MRGALISTRKLILRLRLLFASKAKCGSAAQIPFQYIIIVIYHLTFLALKSVSFLAHVKLAFLGARISVPHGAW